MDTEEHALCSICTKRKMGNTFLCRQDGGGGGLRADSDCGQQGQLADGQSLGVFSL